MKVAPSGRQFDIAAGPHRATLVEVGGGLREYRNDGRPVLDGYPVEEIGGGARGTPLLPWPNRLEDGNYTFAGTAYQLPLTEPAKHNAIHGLVRWSNWSPREREHDMVELGVVLHPQPGYPFPLDISIRYQLTETPTEVRRSGLSVRSTVTNLGEVPCPFASGQHPYLAAGAGLVDEATLWLDAASWLPTDIRGLPTGTEPVDNSPLDFREARPIGGTRIDHAYTGLGRDANGLAWVVLTEPGGQSSRLWADHTYPYVQLYTGDTQPEPRRRRGLAVEPMTSAPNAFRTGEGLVVLQPGVPFTSEWGIQPD